MHGGSEFWSSKQNNLEWDSKSFVNVRVTSLEIAYTYEALWSKIAFSLFRACQYKSTDSHLNNDDLTNSRSL